MKSIDENRTKTSIRLDDDLLQCLKSKDNHRYSRFDAFMWLLENIRANDDDIDDTADTEGRHLLASYSQMAETWHWSRPTVQKFMEELEAMSVISRKRHGNLYAFRINRLIISPEATT